MAYYPQGSGPSGGFDRYAAHNEQSTLHKMKETYWTTKQAVIKKLGKKEDEHIVASDSQLDSKLELFVAIQKQCMELLRVIEKYQDRLCALSQEENAMGRFLKSQSQHDKTRAGKMMGAVGKSQSFSSQQRLALRVPLVRLYQEVETFRYRAISDTLMTINRMESARTEYRGALLWMKDVSDELNPDSYNKLEKFRKVQAQVKKTKARFDKLKLDTMQKIDLLAASRCNMFSHVLANYQSTLLTFWDKTSRTMSAVAESFKGYQYYEFNVIKELAEPSRKLAEETTKEQAERDTDGTDQEGESAEEADEELIEDGDEEDEESDKADDDLLGKDDMPLKPEPLSAEQKSSYPIQQLNSQSQALLQPQKVDQNSTSNIIDNLVPAGQSMNHEEQRPQRIPTIDEMMLISFDEEGKENKNEEDSDSMSNLLQDLGKELSSVAAQQIDSKNGTDDPFLDFGDDEEDTSLEEIKRKQDEEYDLPGRMKAAKDLEKQQQQQQQKIKKGKKDEPIMPASQSTVSESDKAADLSQNILTQAQNNSKDYYCLVGPKDLLTDNFEPDESDKDDMTLLNEILNAPSTGGDDFTREWQAVFGSTPLSSGANINPGETDQPRQNPEFMPSNLLDMTGSGPPQMPMGGAMPQQGQPQPPAPGKQGAKQDKKGQKSDMSAWFNLFAELDPLANPDAVGKQPGQQENMF